MKRTLALLYGVSAYLLFWGAFSYAIAFIGGLGLPKDIDRGPASSIPVAVTIDALLLGLFAVQHSVMARQGFKQQWTRIVPRPVERSTFVIAASLVLALLFWQWRPIPGIVWDLRNTAAATPLTALFGLGWAILLVSTFLVNHFELFGLEQVWTYFREQGFHEPSFKTPGLYQLVRHPIYAGFVIGFWSTPVMTVGHLVFAIAATGYILVGIYFEERDLVAKYGQAYREYRRRVPMLVPMSQWPKSSQELPPANAGQERAS